MENIQDFPERTSKSVQLIAEAVVSRDPTTEGGMVARANELHRAGIVQQCMELFRIVEQLKKNVLRERSEWTAIDAARERDK
jgi:hypothetical protein